MLTREQVRRIDRIAIERYHVPGIVLMENASRAAAAVACDMLGGGDPAGHRVLILCGGGNNGGDGLSIARHLHNRRCDVHIGLLTDPARYAGDAKINWEIVRAMGLPTFPADSPSIRAERADLLIDAIFGTGLTAAPRDPFPAVAAAVNDSGIPVLAIDLPSGLDCNTGEPLGACVRATRTITFVAEKVGFANAQAKDYLGQITVGDIGCPREAIDEAASPTHADPTSTP